ncbi:TonB-dependent receptor [Crocinitomix algicola]|uniref:TonB-dependent receptor n=1 Tax=Crocinitomix algicola TaxID=1740263 RepID=UPI00082AD2B5|nr:carboxypeptidase-like regulatory domain-containing protein [Crocinitomix algicola]
MKVLLFLVSISVTVVFGQTIEKTIRGTVTDNETFEPLIGARVVLLGTEPLIGTMTNLEGEFRLENVPVGRYDLQVSFIGYENYLRPNLDLSSKDLILTIGMTESVNIIDVVTVEATKKGETINQMTTVSNRSFSVEESNRYAGSKNDVARMAQNFAGVQGADDSRNDIVIRGNSPSGVLFRMNGIDIPNPNHFARFGTTGGPISMLNNNVLANSDFMTGAFPAEYGNALAGVFDLNMRNGNNEEHERMFQFGFNGLELMLEGPISKKKGSSYLLNYRYSTLGLFKVMGINFGSTAVPNYQDASFKLNFPSKKGLTSVFGIGGLSTINILAEEADSSDLFALDFSNTRFQSTVGVIGVSHRQRIGSKSYLNFAVGLQTAINNVLNDTVDANFSNPFTTYGSNSTISKQTLDLFYNYKLSAKHLIKVGFHSDLYFMNLQDSVFTNPEEGYFTLRSYEGETFLYQPYVQYQLRPTANITLNFGAHFQGLTLNNSASIEPRFGGAYQLSNKDRISIGYGLHSQMQPIELYFLQTNIGGDIQEPNRNLDFSKSHHFVLGYQRRFPFGINAKIEAYYQYLFDIPVQIQESSYSILNFGADYVSIIPADLKSDGTGENYGAELTLEKYLDKGFYFLITGSIYESFYTASNGNKYNTAFNGNFTSNVLIGYEFRFAEGKMALTLDGKFMINGGRRYTPILLAESQIAGEEIRDQNNIFNAKYSNYARGDFRVGFKIIGKNVTQEWAVDMQNITNRRNIFYQEFSDKSGSIKTTYQTGFLPIGQYRIYF